MDQKNIIQGRVFIDLDDANLTEAKLEFALDHELKSLRQDLLVEARRRLAERRKHA